MSNFSNPIVGILVGAGFTCCHPVLRRRGGHCPDLGGRRGDPFASGAFVLFGTNIGTCITAVLASIGTNRNARRATIIHLLFNVIGTVVFTALVIFLPVTEWISAFVTAPKAQIAAMHTTFNIGTTLLLLPLGNYLAKLAVRILPEHKEEREEGGMHLEYLTPIQFNSKEGGLGGSAIYVDQMQHELRRMLVMAQGERGGQLPVDAEPGRGRTDRGGKDRGIY